MSKKAKGLRRLYQCDDCGTRRQVAWVETLRAAKPKCMACGCTRLELVSDEAKKDLQRLQEERLAGSGGSLLLAPNLEYDRHRLAT